MTAGVFIGWIAAIAFVGATGPVASAEVFTLSRIYARTLQRNEEIGIAREGMRQARDEKYRALSFALPQVTLKGNVDRYPQETIPLSNSTVLLQPRNAYGLEATVEQPLYSGGKNWYALRMANSGIEVANKEVNLSSEAILLHTADVFYGILRDQKDLEVEQRNVQRLTEHRRVSEVRYKVGEVTESILLRAEAELAKAHAELVSRENTLAVKRRELQLLAGLPDNFQIEEPPLPEIPEGNVSQLIDAAMTARDDMKRDRLNEEISKDRVRYARSNFFPSLKFEGTYFSRNQNPRSTFFIDQSWVVGGKIDFPIFEGGLRLAELGQAKSKLEQDRLVKAKREREIDLDVTGAFLTLEAVTRTLASREEQLRFANKNYDMVAKQFAVGLVSNIDLLDANQTLVDAERDVIAATYDRHLAILGLQRSAGVFLPNVLRFSRDGGHTEPDS